MSILADVVCLYNVLLYGDCGLRLMLLPITAIADVVAMWQMVKPLGWIYFNLSYTVAITSATIGINMYL